MEQDELIRIAASVSERRGWDFSRVEDDRDPIPWDYLEVVKRYLQPESRVLDVGTGGGERFMELAPFFGTGVGVDIDPEMIGVARENRPPALAEHVQFAVMPAERLEFPGGEFDIVLNRHSVVHAAEVARVLRPGGFFITQQVGPLNTHNICSLFGCGPGGEYEEDLSQSLLALAEGFRQQGCRVVTRGEYNVRYWFLSVESLIFWLKAIPMPQDFDMAQHWQLVNHILSTYVTERGVQTNEQRDLLIVQKQADGSW
jgi:SAM-dependent methyltransferase